MTRENIIEKIAQSYAARQHAQALAEREAELDAHKKQQQELRRSIAAKALEEAIKDEKDPSKWRGRVGTASTIGGAAALGWQASNVRRGLRAVNKKGVLCGLGLLAAGEAMKRSQDKYSERMRAYRNEIDPQNPDANQTSYTWEQFMEPNRDAHTKGVVVDWLQN